MPEARLTVRVQPGAGQDKIVGFVDGMLRVKVAAPPVKGKANQALVSLLAEALGVREGQVSIVRGQMSRQKVVAIEGLAPSRVEAWLKNLAPVESDLP